MREWLKAASSAAQRGPHAAVVDVAADLDAHAADQRGVLGERRAQPRPVARASRPASTLAAQVRRQRRGALDDGACGGRGRAHQPLEVRQDRQAARGASLRRRARTTCRRSALVQQAVDQADAEQAPGLAPGLFGRLHRDLARDSPSGELPRRFLGQAPLIFRRQDLAGDRRGGLHDQPADLALELGQHAGVVLRRRPRAPWR